MIRMALKNPYLVVVLVLLIAVIGAISWSRIPADLLPTFETQAVLIVCFYPGMPPEVMEQDIMSRLQRWTGQSAGIEHQEAKAMQGVCVVKDFFHEGVTQAEAISQVSMYAMSDMFYLPPGTIPPMVMPFDPTASVPLCLVSVSNPEMNDSELYDVAYKNLRNNLQSINGVIAPAVNGGKLRRILAYVKPERLAAYKLTIMDVHDALRKQNVLIPAGSAKIDDKEFYIYTNAIPDKVSTLNDAPIKKLPDGSQIYFHDIGEVKDTAQIQTNIVRVNGRTLVYVPVYRQPGSNTIEIVERIHSKLEEIRVRLIEEKRSDPVMGPKMQKLKLEVVMDQSVKVRESIDALWWAAVLGAVFAGLVVLLFLRNLRSTFVVVMAIPIAILTSIIGLYFTGNTINAMTLGGLALAVGILIDQAIVVVDNIERHRNAGEGPLQASLLGTQEVAAPLFVSTLTFVVVFFPVIFLSGLAKFLFTPLAMAVLFAVIASFLIAIFFVPVASAKLMSGKKSTGNETGKPNEKKLGWLVGGYRVLLLGALRWKWAVVSISLVLFIGSVWLMKFTGTELFPPVDSGQFTIYVRAKTGTQLQKTEDIVKQVENVIVDEIGDPAPDNPTNDTVYPITKKKFTDGKDRTLTIDEIKRAKSASNCQMLISNIGVLMDWPAAYTPNTGPMDAFVLVQLKDDAEKSVFEYVTDLRKKLNEEFPDVEFAFDTGGILTAALNMGEPSPIHLQVTGYGLDNAHEIADHLMRAIHRVDGATDIRVAQRIDYPILYIDIDRVKAKDLGVTPEEVMKCLVSSTNSSINFDPAFWINPSNGNHYFLGTQYYEEDINSYDSLNYIPIKKTEDGTMVFLSDVAKIHKDQVRPAVVNHRNITRVTDVFVNVLPGYDMGSVVSDIERELMDPRALAFAQSVVPGGDGDMLVKDLTDDQIAELLADDQLKSSHQSFHEQLVEYRNDPLKLFPIKDSRSAIARYPDWFQKGLSALGMNQPTRFGFGSTDFKGYTLDVQGEIRSMRDSFVDFGVGLVLATLLVYLVMVGQFRSFVDPFIVLITVPMGFIGVAVILTLTDTRLNIQSFMGIIMMIGIVVEYTIVLLDFANHRLSEGAGVQEAVVDAAIVRFRPILMTSVTTILALTPMAVGFAGGEADVPLARTIVGGVIAATLLPKFVVPCLYVMIKRRPKTVTEPEPGWA